MRLHWHRRDLRLADNPAVASASADDRVVPVFVLDPSIIDHASPSRMAFVLDALDSLRSDYRERGSDLLVARGHPTDVLPALANEHDATTVTWGDGYSGLARERDDAVVEALAEADVATADFTEAVLHEPGEITTTAGEHYSVYSYFWKKWRRREKPDPSAIPDAEAFATVDGDALPSAHELGVDPPDATIPEAGTAAARERLHRFLENDAATYDARREDPAADVTSRLSPHLTFGTIGVREVYAATESARQAVDGDAADSIASFRSQLAWREFYLQVLDANPSMVSRNLTDFPNGVEWREDEEALAAWRAGQTGVPIVDAGMRQLRTEAWMHNRLRMIVASFLTKDLLIDWRRGYEWFRERLVDHDAANDAGGWQWAASTGTDAVPYFRVFNPWTQGERFDDDATFIRRYVPELADLDSETIHGWNELADSRRSTLAQEYPSLIVDHAAARERAIATFERARGEE